MPQALPLSRYVRTGVVVLLAACVWFAEPRAQEPPPADEPAAPQQPVFRGGVDSVSVDVTVTDRDGRPVTDLTEADFEIREGGELQSVTSFRLIETGQGIDDPASDREILSLSEERAEAARVENRLFVLFLDDYHVRRGNSMRVRQQLSDFLRRLTRNDLVAIATPLSGVGNMSFSRNHLMTSNSVMGFEGRKYDYTPRHPIEYRYQTLPPEALEQMRNSLTISALESLSEYLGTLREGRKTVVYVSEGMSGSIPSGTRTTGSWVGSRPLERGQSQMQQSMDFFENSSLLGDLESRVFRAAQRNNVAIYTVDPRGLAVFESGVDENLSSETDRRIVRESVDLLRVIAEETDGRAIVGSNDPIEGLQQMVRDASVYYLLSYTSTRAPRDGRFHEISVRVTRPGVQVRARKGYWAYSPEDVARATAPARPEAPTEVSEALGVMRSTESLGRTRPVSVWLGALQGVAEKAAVTFAWEAAAAADTPADVVDHVSIVATTLAGDELYRGDIEKAGTARGGSVTFEAPPGPLRVQVIPHNARGTRLDSDEASLEVPDFTGTGPQLTTPFLYRGRTARDLQQVRAAEDPLPVVSAVFARAERMLIRFGAYGAGGLDPAVNLRLLNQNGEQLAVLPAPAKRTGEAGGFFEAEMGLGSFPPGEYLIEIGVEQGGEQARRLVAVRITG